MSDFPGRQALPITVWTKSIYGHAIGTRAITLGDTTLAGVAWGTGNLAIYTPIFLPMRYPVRNMFVALGGTVNGNVDIGIYNHDLVRLVSAGTTAIGSASSMQFFACDIVLEPGCYYLAWTMSGTTCTVQCSFNSTATRARYYGLLQQATALPLPANATPAAMATLARMPAVGFTFMSGTPSFG